MKKITLLLALLLMGQAYANGFLNEKVKGWFWYEVKPEPEPVKKEEKKQEETPPVIIYNPVPTQLTSQQVIEQQKKEREEALADAVVKGDEASIRRYMKANGVIIDQAQTFAEKVQAFTYVNPEFDRSIGSTITKKGDSAEISFNQKNQEVDANLTSIAKTYGLLFVFRSDCPYCHKTAPIINLFGQKHSFSVLPVSMDGKGIPGFAKPVINPGLIRKLNVKVVPAVYLVNPKTNDVRPISFGTVGLSDLERKVISGANYEFK